MIKHNFFGTPFAAFFEGPVSSCGARDTHPSYGRSDFEENGDTYTIELEVPGISKDNIQVDLKEHVLTVSWTRKREEEKRTTGRYERPEGDFSRRFYVKGADPEKVTADLKDGILKVELVKHEKLKEKSIKIN